MADIVSQGIALGAGCFYVIMLAMQMSSDLIWDVRRWWESKR